MPHEADLDGNCENCGRPIGFHGTHTTEQCVEALKGDFKTATTALDEALAVSRDRQAFVALGPRGWIKAESILTTALNKLGLKTER
jgi:hypothetical protein